jgi:O-antigen/teichoic acid export membrane protein
MSLVDGSGPPPLEPHSPPRGRKVAGTLASRFATVALGGAGTVVAARALGPPGQGTYQVVVTVGLVAISLGHLSIEQANTYLWHRGASRQVLATNAVLLGLVSGVGASAIAWIVTSVIGVGAFSTSDRRYLGIVLLAIPGSMISLYLANICTLDDRIGRVNAARLLAVGGQFVFLLILFINHRLNVMEAVATWAVIAALPCVILAPGLHIRLSALSWKTLGAALAIGLRYHWAMAALFLLWRVDTFILNALSTRQQVGLYAIAVPLAELLYLFVDSVSVVYIPRQLSNQSREAAQLTARLSRINLLLCCGGAVCIAACSPVLLPAVFGSSYSGSVAPLLVILPGVVALGIIRPLQVMLLRLNRPVIVSAFCFSALVVNIVVNLALIPTLGAVGASASSTIAYVGLAAGYGAWFLRSYGVHAQEMVPGWDDVKDVYWVTRRTLHRVRAASHKARV